MESSHRYEVTLARRVLYSRLPCICLIHLLTRYPHLSTRYGLLT